MSVAALLCGRLALLGMAGLTLAGCHGRTATSGTEVLPPPAAASSIELSPTQLSFVTVHTVTEHGFVPVREGIGYVDFDQDRTVQVSSPWPGRMLRAVANAGQRVRRGDVLFTLQSPDLVEAESTFISTAGVLRQASAVLERARGLQRIEGIAQKDYEQAVADQQSAAAAHAAARASLEVFGLDETRLQRLLARRDTDAELPIHSPIDGLVVARNAAPGALLQPGSTPAPYTVSDVARKWLIAQLPEADAASIREGMEVEARLVAQPDKSYRGTVANVAAALDLNTHRTAVRAEVPDPRNELRPQMLVSFHLTLGEVQRSPAVPATAVVREGDGTQTVWVTRDARRFTRRAVRIGSEQDGLRQVLGGLAAGERVAATGAIFLSNAAVLGGAE